jgi:hypothetical protein
VASAGVGIPMTDLVISKDRLTYREILPRTYMLEKATQRLLIEF